MAPPQDIRVLTGEFTYDIAKFFFVITAVSRYYLPGFPLLSTANGAMTLGSSINATNSTTEEDADLAWQLPCFFFLWDIFSILKKILTFMAIALDVGIHVAKMRHDRVRVDVSNDVHLLSSELVFHSTNAYLVGLSFCMLGVFYPMGGFFSFLGVAGFDLLWVALAFNVSLYFCDLEDVKTD